PGARGRSAPGWEVAVVHARGELLPSGTVGEIAVRRKDGWFRVRDRGWMDEEGYFHHEGRSDDMIISAGWTMSAVEIEDALLSHPDVREAAVVAAPDELRGQIPKAYVVSERTGSAFARELQEWVGARLSQHEYPRAVELVEELPKTPAGKTDRQALRGGGGGDAGAASRRSATRGAARPPRWSARGVGAPRPPRRARRAEPLATAATG